MNGYLLFCEEMRPELRDENPDISFEDMGRRLGEMWRKLTPSERNSYYAERYDTSGTEDTSGTSDTEDVTEEEDSDG
jgi:hypothetical protein